MSFASIEGVPDYLKEPRDRRPEWPGAHSVAEFDSLQAFTSEVEDEDRPVRRPSFAPPQPVPAPVPATPLPARLLMSAVDPRPEAEPRPPRRLLRWILALTVILAAGGAVAYQLELVPAERVAELPSVSAVTERLRETLERLTTAMMPNADAPPSAPAPDLRSPITTRPAAETPREPPVPAESVPPAQTSAPAQPLHAAAGAPRAPLAPVRRGLLFVNARPWADVWIDGRLAGTTPLANVSVTVGDHEILWRHPQLGERRQSVKVTGDAPTRIGIDLRTP